MRAHFESPLFVDKPERHFLVAQPNEVLVVSKVEERVYDEIFIGKLHAGVSVIAIIKNNIVKIKCIPQSYRSTDKLDDFGNAVIKNLTEDECHLTTYMVPAYKQYIDDEHDGNTKLLISFSIYEDEATISFHWNVPKD